MTGIRDYTGEELKSQGDDNFDFYWTGHPFVDAGLVAILLIAGKNKPEDLTKDDVERAIKFASQLYATKEWKKYLHGMVFPNSGILMCNPSMSKKRSSGAITQNLWDILKGGNVPSIEAPTCIICGRRPAYPEKEVYRSVFPLLGTGDVLNYFPSANPKGVDICAHCIFLTQFFPLASYRLPRVLIIHAYPYELMLELSKEALNDINRSKLASSARGFTKPENFLFHLIGEITRKVDTDKLWENASVTLYYFVSNNQNQNLDIIHIPTPVLRFIAYANLIDYTSWRRIVAMGWREKPKDDVEFENMEREKQNMVYSKLLNYESILDYFLNKSDKNVNAGWNLLAFYCKEVIGLEKEELEFIKNVGDRIVDSLEKLPDHKLDDEIRSLERAEKLYQFEAFFIRVEKIRQEKGIEKPLMTFDEFTKILAGYGEEMDISWKTVKNLLLFRIYERLHDRLAKLPKSENENINVEESEEYAIYGGDVR